MRRVVRGIGIALVALLLLLVVAAGTVYRVSEGKLNRSYSTPAVTLPPATGSEAVERGRYLVSAVTGCEGCHGPGLKDQVFVDDPALGRIVAPNLTKGQGGVGGSWSDADFARVLRYGVLPNGHSALIMPAKEYTHLSDADLAAVIAYVRSLPPVDNVLPGSQLGLPGRALLALGQLPIQVADQVDVQAARPAVQAGVTAGYGGYLVSIAGCASCHGSGLQGGRAPGSGPDARRAPNLTPGGAPGRWTEAQFVQTIRTGADPSGHVLNPEAMSWPAFARTSDDDLRAVWAYLRQVPAQP